MNDNEIKDCQFTAIKLQSGMLSSTVDELISMGIIRSHRDLVPDNIKEVRDRVNESAVTNKTRNNFDRVVSMADSARQIADDYIHRAEHNNIHTVSVSDKEYPYVWRFLAGMPKVIFTMGDKSILMDTFMSGAVSVVGSRNPSKYSLYACEQFTRELSTKGIVVVSGMALGIDGEAHRTTLCNGGKTIGVTPGGPDVIYPYQHEKLYKDMYMNGLILSEMPPGQNMMKQYFPSRNRLISALSDACLIMEAGRYSGTLHTASFAGSQGKELFVLPNSIYCENAIGGLLLIRDGAEVLIDSDTVVERIKNIVVQRVNEDGMNYPELLNRGGIIKSDDEDVVSKMTHTPELMSDKDWKVVIKSFIEQRPRNFDELIKLIPIDTSRLMRYLSEMEFAGDIETDRDKYVLTIQKL